MEEEKEEMFEVGDIVEVEFYIDGGEYYYDLLFENWLGEIIEIDDYFPSNIRYLVREFNYGMVQWSSPLQLKPLSRKQTYSDTVVDEETITEFGKLLRKALEEKSSGDFLFSLLVKER